MSLITAMLMFVPSLNAQGITFHNRVGSPALTFAAQQHLAQQYDPASLPPEIMMPERRPVGRQRAAPPIAVVPLDPPPPEQHQQHQQLRRRYRKKSAHRMVRSGGEREGAAVPKRGITEGAAVTRRLSRERRLLRVLY